MLKFLFLVFCAFTVTVSSADAQKKEKSKCEMWVTFYNLDERKNKEAFNIVANHIRGNSNFLIVGDSNFDMKDFHNFCIDIIDNKVQKEFDTVSNILMKQKQTGFVSVETKIGAKFSRL